MSQAIINLISDYETAWLQANGAGVASFLDPNALYFDGTSCLLHRTCQTIDIRN